MREHGPHFRGDTQFARAVEYREGYCVFVVIITIGRGPPLDISFLFRFKFISLR